MRILSFVTALNITLLLLYRFFEINLPTFMGNRLFLFLLLLLVSPLLWAYFQKNEKTNEKLTGIQISVLSCFIFVCLFELSFRMAPQLFPENMQHLVELGVTTNEERKNSVELLPHNPYAKPKANTRIHIPGYYGPRENFVYEWTSDKRGFKNSTSIAERAQIDTIILGDSFTEGMGVEIEETFASQLSARGFPAYSFGVQGYAPFQFLGIYENYARDLKPKTIFIGYLTGISARDSFFLKPEKQILEEKQFPSAIGRLVERDDMIEQKVILMETDDGYQVPVLPSVRHKFAISALLSLTGHIVNFKKNFDITSGVKNPELDARFMKDVSDKEIALTLMSRYKGEFKNLETILVEDIKAYGETETWKLTEKTFSSIIKKARENGSEVVLLFFPDRGYTYYTKATGKPKNSRMIPAVESRLMQEFAKKERIQMLDVSPALEKYVARLTESSSILDYPYLKIDGHPSQKGHEVIATELENFLKSRGEVLQSSK